MSSNSALPVESSDSSLKQAHEAVSLSPEVHLYYCKLFEDAASYHRHAFMQSLLLTNVEEAVQDDAASSSKSSVYAQGTVHHHPSSSSLPQHIIERNNDPVINDYQPEWRKIFH